MERDLSSYRDRAQSFSQTPQQPQQGGFVRHLLGMTTHQRELGKMRKDHVREKLNKQRDYVKSYEREKRQVFEDFDKGRLDEFQKYGITKYEYKSNPEAARKKIEQRMKRNRMRELHDLDISYNKQWKEKAKELKDKGASTPTSNLAA